MSNTIELNQGEIKVKFLNAEPGKISLSDLGLGPEDLVLEGGLLRLVIDIEGIGEHKYFKVPTLEITYDEEVSETHWICEFNNVTILDKVDHYGHSTILLLDRKQIKSLEHHHENKLIVHAEFPQKVHLNPEKSFLNLFV